MAYKYGTSVKVTFPTPLTSPKTYTYSLYEKSPIVNYYGYPVSNTPVQIYVGKTFIMASPEKPVSEKIFDITDIVTIRRWNCTDVDDITNERVNLINKYYIALTDSEGNTLASTEAEQYFYNVYPNKSEDMVPISQYFDYETITLLNNTPFVNLIQGNFYPQGDNKPVLLPRVPYQGGKAVSFVYPVVGACNNAYNQSIIYCKGIGMEYGIGQAQIGINRLSPTFTDKISLTDTNHMVRVDFANEPKLATRTLIAASSFDAAVSVDSYGSWTKGEGYNFTDNSGWKNLKFSIVCTRPGMIDYVLDLGTYRNNAGDKTITNILSDYQETINDMKQQYNDGYITAVKFIIGPPTRPSYNISFNAVPLLFNSVYIETLWNVTEGLQYDTTSLTVKFTLGSASDELLFAFDCCPAKYYLLWQDRGGGFQCQPFAKTETYSESFKRNEYDTYRNAKKLASISIQPQWKLNSEWINEELMPYYESLYVSPYIELWDVENNERYNVYISDNSWTEKTFKNQGRKLFNLQVTVKQDIPQQILY